MTGRVQEVATEQGSQTGSNEYEIVDGNGDDLGDDLDDLEAEIARELGED